MYKIIIIVTLSVASLTQGFVIPRNYANKTDVRIVGGESAPDGAVPYQISMWADGRHICGGCILNKRWILSAAHCFDGSSAQGLSILVGTNRLNSGGTRYPVERIISHDQWTPSTFSNDIGLLKVTQDIAFTDKVKPIGLPSGDTGTGATLLASGWGFKSEPGTTPNDLQWIRLTSISVEQCRQKMGDKISDLQICTYTQAGQGTCRGDSGGPLAEGNAVVGVVSFGIPCAKGYPDVFTRVLKYKNWILDRVRVQ